jgi:HEAT repeat protein
MPEGRAPWPRFAGECRKVIGAALSPLGFLAKPTSGNYARFDRGSQRVELSWDAYDVTLTTQVDGVSIGRLLHAAGLKAEASSMDRDNPPLPDVANSLLALLGRDKLGEVVAATAAEQKTLSEGSEAACIGLLASAEDPVVRANAAGRLGDLPKASAKAVAALARALGDSEATVRSEAASALYHVGDRSAKVATRALVAVLGDDAPKVRSGSLLALRQLGIAAAEAADAIANVVQSGTAADATLAMDALIAIDQARAKVEADRLGKSTRKRERERGAHLGRLIALRKKQAGRVR